MTHARSHIHLPRHLGERASDALTGFAGSWRFLGIHAVWFVVWIVLPVEAFPFGLLTMVVSLEAIFLSTLVMMSQNRQATRDRVRDDLEASEVDELFAINKQQVEMHKTELEILGVLRGIQTRESKR